MTHRIRRELRFTQPPEAVWKALATRDALADWMYPNDFEARAGHHFTFQVPPSPQLKRGLIVHCEVLICTPPRELSFTWVVEGFLNTQVSYRLEPDGLGTRVFFEHGGFEKTSALGGASYGWNIMHGLLEKGLEQAQWSEQQ